MTIIEAIKSGKAFRRSGRLRWIKGDCRYLYFEGDTSNRVEGLTTEEIKADDWEVKKATEEKDSVEYWISLALQDIAANGDIKISNFSCLVQAIRALRKEIKK